MPTNNSENYTMEDLQNVLLYPSGYDGPTIDQAIYKILNLNIKELTGWLKLVGTQSDPIDLNDIKTIGNYIITYFINGSTGFQYIKPINLIVAQRDGQIFQYVSAMSSMYYRIYEINQPQTWGEWDSVSTEEITLPDGRTLQEVLDNLVQKTYSFSYSAGDSYVKEVNVNNYVHNQGAQITLIMKEENTVSPPVIRINDDDETKGEIYYGGKPITPDMIGKDVLHLYMFDGTYWNIINPVIRIGLSDLDPLLVADVSSSIETKYTINNFPASKIIITGTQMTVKFNDIVISGATLSAGNVIDGEIYTSNGKPIKNNMIFKGAYVSLIYDVDLNRWWINGGGGGAAGSASYDIDPILPSIKDSENSFTVNDFSPHDEVVDGTVVITRFEEDVPAGSSLSAGGVTAPIYTVDGKPIRSWVIAKGSMVQFIYNKELDRWYTDNGGTGAVTSNGDESEFTVAYTKNTKTKGSFYSGTSEPSNTDRLNYDGNMHVTNLFVTNDAVIGNGVSGGYLKIDGNTKTAGSFYAGTAEPSNTDRLNYDGNLWTTNVITRSISFDRLLPTAITTEGTGAAYTVNIRDFTYVNFATAVIRLHALSENNPTLNINGIGTRNLLYCSGKQPRIRHLAEGSILMVIYSTIANAFYIIGGGGGAAGVTAASPSDINPIETDFSTAFTFTAGVDGTFNNTTTNPSKTTRINYEGNMYVTNFWTTGNTSVGGNLTVNGTTKSAGSFYTGVDTPTNTGRLNYDGNMHVTNLTTRLVSFDHLAPTPINTTGSGVSYSATIVDWSLTNFRSAIIKLHIQCGDNPTININNTGDKKLLYTSGKQPRARHLGTNAVVMIIYSSSTDSYYIIGGGASGGVRATSASETTIDETDFAMAFSFTKLAGSFYNGTTNPSATTRLNYDGNLHVMNLTAVTAVNSSTISTTGNASIGGTLTVTGNSTLNGNLIVNGNTKAAGSFYTGAVNPSATNRLNYDGNLHVMNLTAVTAVNSSTISTTGNASIGGTLTVTGNSTLNGNLIVNGNTKTAGSFYTGTTNPSATNRLNYDGNLHVTTLTSVTAVSSATLSTTGNASIGGTLNVVGNTSITGNLSVTGATKAAGVFYTGTSNPTNTNRLNYDGNLYVMNLIAVGTLTITGTTKTMGYFYAGTSDPTNTSRLNYDGSLYAYQFRAINGIYGSFLSITGTTAAAGYFYAGNTNPSATTRLNYDGNLHVTNLTTITNVVVGGTLRINGTTNNTGQFYAGATDPNNTTRLNYNGNLHVTNLTATDRIYAVAISTTGGITAGSTLTTTDNASIGGVLIVNGSTKTAGSFYTGINPPTNTNRLNYDGDLWVYKCVTRSNMNIGGYLIVDGNVKYPGAFYTGLDNPSTTSRLNYDGNLHVTNLISVGNVSIGGKLLINGVESNLNRAATVIVGLGSSGYTTKDVDILIPSGTSNCISYLNKAISDILPSSTGGKILLLSGTYVFNSPWVIERNNLTIEGMGAGTILNMEGARNSTTTAIAAQTNNSVIYMKGNNNTVKNLRVSTPDTTGISFGIYLNAASNNNITNVICSNIGGASYGIYLNAASNKNTIANNTCNNVNNDGYHSFGIYLSGSLYNIISNNIINTRGAAASYVSARSSGIFLAAASNENIITGNLCSNHEGSGSYGIYISASLYNTIGDNICTNSGTLGTTEGIFLVGSTDNTITGNTFNGSGKVICVRLDSSSNNIISSNTCGGGGSTTNNWGIRIEKASNKNIISNNICNNSNNNNSSVGDVISYGIDITGSSYNVITGNIIQNINKGTTFSDNISYGISFFSSAINNNISGNTINNTCINGEAISIFNDATSVNNIFDGIIRRSTPPGTPFNTNAIWINTSTHVQYHWTGTKWEPIRGVAN